jgi:RNA polymerase sigma factor for flagellar operon FliA
VKQTAASGADNREELILAHIPSIKYHAYRIIGQLPPIVDVGDLINAGVLGLMEAIERFDPSRGVKFRTFADQRIRGAMLDSLRALTWMPKALRRRGKQLEALRKELRQEPGADADEERLSKEMGITLEELHGLIQRLRALSIGAFAPSGTSDDLTFYPDTVTEGPHYQFERQELRNVLAQAIEGLGRKEKLVVSLYYFEELTMKEIGLVLKVNESRVSQIHSNAMAQLRSRLQDFGNHRAREREPAPAQQNRRRQRSTNGAVIYTAGSDRRTLE